MFLSNVEQGITHSILYYLISVIQSRYQSFNKVWKIVVTVYYNTNTA